MPVFWVLAADLANHLYEQSEWYAKTKSHLTICQTTQY